MRFSSLTLLTVSAVASQVAGGVIEARSSLESIFRRQTTPSICTTECSTFQNSLDVCTTTGCLCTRPVATSLNNCVNCYYQNSPTVTVYNTANELISSYESTCAGVPGLPPVSVTTRPGGVGTSTTSPSTSRDVLTTTTTPGITGPITTIEPPISRTTIRPPTNTADGASTTVTAPNGNSGNSGNNGGGLPGLGSGAQSLSAGVHPAVMVVAFALGAFAL
ncbi:hypothetical protein EST38_g2074 [Candolleomyces aberdarensis]|uniref:Uncharacterized protein n=1 Tax=Candolleomyces aberdarensis TaxID=2316362 RepID=A0A4V1Q4Z2_9AGAR|nr:hypothetical protein EST38_g2074 [Candolleomyces aberdarensis]